MTYRELIMYVLANNLENEEVFKNGKPVGFLTVQEAAVKLGVGVETINARIALNTIKYFKLGNCYFLPDYF